MFKIIIKEAKKQPKSDIDVLLDNYTQKLLAAGYDVNDRTFIDKGTQGEAYLLKSGKVIKVTRDPSEALSSAVIAGKETNYLVRIEKVFNFKKDGHYAIIMENLDPISNEEMNFWNELSDTGFLRDILVSPPKSWEEIEPTLKQLWIEKWDANTVEQFLQNAKKYNFPEMLNELKMYGITFYDFHGDNIMKRGNQSVVIDLGYSTREQNAKIPVLEKKK